MLKPIEDFARLFDAELGLDRSLVVRKGDKFFLLSPNLRALTGKGKEWLFAGTYLGKIESGKFHPSFPLLFMIADNAKNKVVVDDKAAWLFVCGRDIFKEGVLEAHGSRRKGAHILVLNRYGECLGFGIMAKDLDKAKKGVVIKNILDVGDFLRRERGERTSEA
jgi:ribosome biogenesis protein Nip4